MWYICIYHIYFVSLYIEKEETNLEIKVMKGIKVYTVKTIEKRIVSILKKAKFAIETKYLIEGCHAEFCYYQFCEALGNLYQQGIVVYNETIMGYELADKKNC